MHRPDRLTDEPPSRRRQRPQRAFLTGALAACVVANAATSRAQAPPPASRVVPESVAPPRATFPGTLALPEQATAEAPPDADRLTVTVAGVAVDGELSGSPAGVVDAIAATKRELPRHVATIADIYAAAGRIEAAYARAGFVLTRVTVPPQRIVDGGTVRLLVIDGFIESVDVDAVPARVRAVVRRRVAGLVGVRGLTLARIERRVLLAGEAPGVRLRSTLERGTATGGTTLVLDARYQPVTATLSADNSQGGAYRHEALSAQLALNSVLGLGEQLYLTATNGPDLGHIFSRETRRAAVVGADLARQWRWPDQLRAGGQ